MKQMTKPFRRFWRKSLQRGKNELRQHSLRMMTQRTLSSRKRNWTTPIRNSCAGSRGRRRKIRNSPRNWSRMWMQFAGKRLLRMKSVLFLSKRYVIAGRRPRREKCARKFRKKRIRKNRMQRIGRIQRTERIQRSGLREVVCTGLGKLWEWLWSAWHACLQPA